MSAHDSHRWAIAGIGVTSSLGSDVDEVFDALCAGRSGIAPLRHLDPQRFRSYHAYEVTDEGTTGRATRWLCQAIEAACRQAGIGEDLSDVPVLVGTGLRELRSLELRWTDGEDFALSRLHFGAALRERFGAASSYTVSNACSASLYLLAVAADLLATEQADTVVVAGVDSITASMYGLMDRVQRPPVTQVRPFDRHRPGALMGEGAAAVVLRRSGPAVSWLRGVGVNCDAYHVTAPDVAGITAAIADAHDRSAVTPADVDLVVAHGTGTALNDQAEAVALGTVFTSSGARPLVTGLKSMLGHTSGASGLMSIVAAAGCLQTGIVPPVVGLREPADEARGLRLVTMTAAKADLVLAQVNAFGFGGVNAVAILEKAA